MAIQLLRSSVPGRRPTAGQLLPGQLFVNTADEQLFLLNSAGVVVSVSINADELATVAKTGQYSDLLGKPTIPTQYELPIATAGALGGIRIGQGVSIDPATGVITAVVRSVAGKTGAVTLSMADVGLPSDFLDAQNKVQIQYLPDSILGALNFVGVWNAATNTPTIPAASTSNKGDYYRVSIAGATLIDGAGPWSVGDWLISEGSAWTRMPGTSGNVTSVNTQTGDVVINAGNLPGLAEVAKSNSYDDLDDTPTLAAVATSGSYNDLTNKPLDSSICQIAVNVHGTPNILEDESFIATRPASFPVNFVGSVARATLISGTTASVSVKVNGVAVGSITFDQNGLGSLSTVASNPVPLAVGDLLTYSTTTTNMSQYAISLRGNWTA